MAAMNELRDYERWHDLYEDPGSGMAWRLSVVQAHIRDALDAHAGPCQVLSLCAGDGRDVLQVLARRTDVQRVRLTLVEVLPALAERAAATAAQWVPDAAVQVRTEDAGTTRACRGAVPADLLLLVGVFGNIDPLDVQHTIAAAPQLCAPGARVLWSKGRRGGDDNDQVRGWFSDAGFAELAYHTHERGSWPAVGLVRYQGTTQPLSADLRLFTFRR